MKEVTILAAAVMIVFGSGLFAGVIVGRRSGRIGTGILWGIIGQILGIVLGFGICRVLEEVTPIGEWVRSGGVHGGAFARRVSALFLSVGPGALLGATVGAILGVRRGRDNVRDSASRKLKRQRRRGGN